MQRYVSVVYAMALSVCLFACLSSRCSTKTAKRHHMIAQGIYFLMPEISAGHQMQLGWVKIGDFRQITGYISKTV